MEPTATDIVDGDDINDMMQSMESRGCILFTLYKMKGDDFRVKRYHNKKESTTSAVPPLPSASATTATTNDVDDEINGEMKQSTKSRESIAINRNGDIVDDEQFERGNYSEFKVLAEGKENLLCLLM